MKKPMKSMFIVLTLLALTACQSDTQTEKADSQVPEQTAPVQEQEAVAYQYDPVKPAVKKDHAELLNKYATFRLTSDLSHLSGEQQKILAILIEAAKIMDELFWLQSYGAKQPFLAGIENQRLRKFAEINYGPWDRLDGDKAFIPGVEDKFIGANFYPKDLDKAALKPTQQQP